MALDLKNSLDILDKPETQKIIADILARDKREAAMYKSQLKRFHDKYKDKLPEVIEKVIAKYESDAYVSRERQMGYESREHLYWFLLSYARKHGKAFGKKQEKLYPSIMNMFTSEAYVIAGYVFQRMDGQGSVVRVDKLS